ncbi:OmpA family protein [Paracoccus sp. (in: a-proteobacteria)]|uniref:OmpA family protein n=1 Tax=Paracoccus sp. TaxID=267 RepID=UPI00289B836B|nr:OmpA family protein [Paracoccus sp. (in: a-proteobacteria)]
MRAQGRQLRHEEEEESAFVSMTDMTVGFLFIMMILLAFFASQMRDPDAVRKEEHEAVIAQRDSFERERDSFQQERDRWKALAEELMKKVDQLEQRLAQLVSDLADRDRHIDDLERQLAELRKVDPLEAYLAQVSQVRRLVLTRLRDAIRADFPDLQVELSEESDALRFQGEGLFASGRSDLAIDKEEIVSRLAHRLDEVLPCFTLGANSRFDTSCNPGFVMVESVQIEGHTDNVGTDLVNRSLSAARANSTFFAMTGAAGEIMQHLNLKRQPVLSVAAYGPDRPVAANDTPGGQATNRRIDLRFIMVTPQDTDGIKVIREALEMTGAHQ